MSKTKSSTSTKTTVSKSASKREKNQRTLWLVCRCVEAALVITIGILAIIYPTKFLDVIMIMLGVFLILDSIIRILRYYVEAVKMSIRGRGLIGSCLEMSLGLVMCIEYSSLTSTFRTLSVMFLACLLFAGAGILICEASVRVYKHNRNTALIICEYLLAVVLLVGGILLIVFKADVLTAAIIILGLLLIAWGGLLIFYGFRPMDKKVENIAA